ncbi:Aldo/keto reductase [Trametes elegans]|nr:Aldo/keto reductase [Trametes elegans]
MSPNGIPSLELNDGTSMPAVGIGCWMGVVGEGEHVTTMVQTALVLGYRHIDTAAKYGNERSVGAGLRASGVPREEVFLTTKLDQKDHGRVGEALATSLSKLGVDYVDLYLMHWPMASDDAGKTLQPDESPTFVETWREMENLLATGKARTIGVSNFSITTLTALLAHATITPAVNQVELHPCLPQHALLAFCAAHGIRLTAYSPLGKHKFAAHPAVASIAAANGPPATSARALLSWGVQRGTAVVPKTVRAERMAENLQLVRLSAEEVGVLDRLHAEPGMHRSVCGFHSGELGGSCFGWTYGQLGWEMTLGGVHL